MSPRHSAILELIVSCAILRSLADVTYNTASFPSLIRTLQTLIRRGDPNENKKSPLVVLGYKERDAAERSLWDMAAGIGVALEKVDERQGAGGNPVEIWLADAAAAKELGASGFLDRHRHTDRSLFRAILIGASCAGCD